MVAELVFLVGPTPTSIELLLYSHHSQCRSSVESPPNTPSKESDFDGALMLTLYREVLSPVCAHFSIGELKVKEQEVLTRKLEWAPFTRLFMPFSDA